MKRYLIRKHCEATVVVTIASGREQNYYYGDKPEHLSRDMLPIDAEIERYGYHSIDDAKPKFDAMVKSAEEETKRGYWVVSVTIEEVEV